jgi:hypothetical protein
MIEAMYYRKTGKEKVVTEVSKEVEEKIKSMAPKVFKPRRIK